MVYKLAPQDHDHRAEEGLEKHVSDFRYCHGLESPDLEWASTDTVVGPPDFSPSGIFARRGPEVEAQAEQTSTSSPTSSSIGPITGEELTLVLVPEGLVSPTP